MGMPADASDVITAEELERIEIPGKTTELIRGQLVVHEPPGIYHSHIAARLTYLLGGHVYPARLGCLYAQDAGFRLRSQPDTVRGADVAFVAAHRVEDRKRGYGTVAPDLIAEIVSPNDRASEVLAKVADWLDAGVRVAWVIDPQRGEAYVYRPDGGVERVAAAGHLTANEVLADVRISLADVLEPSIRS